MNLSTGADRQSRQPADDDDIVVAMAVKLLDQVREAIRMRHYSRRTEQAYVVWIRRYIVFHGKRHPTGLGARRTSEISCRRSPRSAM